MMARITLKAARVNVGLTQHQAAAAVGVNVSTLKNWESGKSYPRQPEIEALCAVYGVTYDQLFFGK